MKMGGATTWRRAVWFVIPIKAVSRNLEQDNSHGLAFTITPFEMSLYRIPYHPGI